MAHRQAVGIGIACFLLGAQIFTEPDPKQVAAVMLDNAPGWRTRTPREFWHWVNAGASYLGVKPESSAPGHRPRVAAYSLKMPAMTVRSAANPARRSDSRMSSGATQFAMVSQ